MPDQIVIQKMSYQLLKWLCETVPIGEWHQNPTRDYPANVARSSVSRALRLLEQSGCVEAMQIHANGRIAARVIVAFDDPRILVSEQRGTKYPRPKPQKKRKLIRYCGWDGNEAAQW